MPASPVTKGFGDILTIGNQSRPSLFDLSVYRPKPLAEEVVEVDERVLFAEQYSKAGLPVVEATTGEKIQVVRTPGASLLCLLARSLRGRPSADRRRLLRVCCDPPRSRRPPSRARAPVRRRLPVALGRLHALVSRSLSYLRHRPHAAADRRLPAPRSYIYPAHEEAVGALAESIGFSHVSLSSKVAPVIRLVNRANSSTADAYLTPELKRYLAGFKQSFVNLDRGVVAFMQSDGGLVDVDGFSGLKAVLSGPAGGVVGYAKTCYDEEDGTPIIGFDMVRPAFLARPRNSSADPLPDPRCREEPALTSRATRARSSTSSSRSRPASSSTRRCSTSTRCVSLALRSPARPLRTAADATRSLGRSGRRRWRIVPDVPQRPDVGRARVGRRAPGPGVLPQGRAAHRHGRQRLPWPHHPVQVRLGLLVGSLALLLTFSRAAFQQLPQDLWPQRGCAPPSSSPTPSAHLN